MRRKPTIEEAHKILVVIDQVIWTRNSIAWGSYVNMTDGRALCRAISGYRPSKGNCHSCETTVLNILREAVNLPPMGRPASADLQAHRLTICKTCPAHHKRTNSCGRLVLDAVDPKPVMINGASVSPCGCYLPLKTSMKHSTCPANLW